MSDTESETIAGGKPFLKQRISARFYILFQEERTFLALIGLFFVIAGVTFPNDGIAKWVGFALAGYSAIANDSIQTIGTFLASNKEKKWWVLWLFVGGSSC
ncbi:MAG: hypothetical protein R3281_08090 [Balneolaceae bacterium]|nr:hypothetical protein [Balneolaceae bacterium]